MMNLEEVVEYTGWTEAEVKQTITRDLGKITTAWRCGESGRTSDSSYDCSCDSVLCDLGEEVIVLPKAWVNGEFQKRVDE